MYTDVWYKIDNINICWHSSPYTMILKERQRVIVIRTTYILILIILFSSHSYNIKAIIINLFYFHIWELWVSSLLIYAYAYNIYVHKYVFDINHSNLNSKHIWYKMYNVMNFKSLNPRKMIHRRLWWKKNCMICFCCTGKGIDGNIVEIMFHSRQNLIL